jgi:hypothetical protein
MQSNSSGLTRNGVVITLTIVTILVVGFIFSNCALQDGAKAAHVQAELETEYQAIRQLPGAKSKRYHASHKVWQALVSSEYHTTYSYPEIRTYYDSELSKLGWVFIREEDVIYGDVGRGKNYGGKHLYYRKGEYIADLQYAGKQEDMFGWTYAFSLSWGLN